MNNRVAQFLLVAVSLMLCLKGCKTNAITAPADKVPKRSALEYDAYGGKISLQTNDSLTYSGEFIGVRNDSVIVLSDTDEINSIYNKSIATARVIVYNPILYNGAYGLMMPNVFLLVHTGEFGGGPLGLSLLLSAIDLAGIAVAKNAEKNRINYYDWSDGWNEFNKYSRFPSGVPQHLVLSDLKGRPPLSTKKK